MAIDPDQVLTTPQGTAIPDALFAGRLDKQARLLMLEAQKSVLLYRDTAFYATGRPSLYAHVMGLLGMFLTIPEVAQVFAQRRDVNPETYDFCTTVGRMILLHDDAETWAGEGMSFSQKMQAPQLEEKLRAYEAESGPGCYHLALCYAASGQPEGFLQLIESCQKEYQIRIERMTGDALTAAHAEEWLDEVRTSLAVRCMEVADYLSDEERPEVLANQLRYERDFDLCENPDKRQYSAAAVFTKLLDKNCALYLAHAEKKYAHPVSADRPLTHETNRSVLETIRRSESNLPAFLNLAKDNPGAQPFANAAIDLTYRRMARYAAMVRPLIHLDEGKLLLDVDETYSYADLARMHELMRQELQERRETVHPLDDRMMIAKEELVAKLRLMQRHQIVLTSVLSPGENSLQAFRGEFDTLLQDVRQERQRAEGGVQMTLDGMH